MRIYSMTATFGKLNHETLTLQPGLNIIHAPNEWGKSTWCAFLTAMLYGLDTRTHTTKTALSDRERYTPWSGAPMAGSIDLRWQGRDITIQRRTKGRTPMGEFKAFETHTGLPVPELTAANCGQVLLGVEKSVFLRSAFLRLTDLPVTQDESLRRRLNALVTTGDDSDTAQHLEKKLRALKNRCRHNRTGLLPQAEAEAAALEQKLRDLNSLETQIQKLDQQQTDAQARLDKLENHRAALNHRKYLADAAKMTQAEAQFENARQKAQQLETRCANHPDRETVRRKLAALEDLIHRQNQLEQDILRLTPISAPDIPIPHLQGLDPEAAGCAARADAAAWQKADARRSPLWLLPGLLVMAAAAGLLLWTPAYAVAGWSLLAVGAVLSLAGFALMERNRKIADELARLYPRILPDQWEVTAKRYATQIAASTDYNATLESIQARKAALAVDTISLCGTHSPEGSLARLMAVQQDLDVLEAAKTDWQQSLLSMNTIRSLVRPVAPPSQPDSLELSPEETVRQIADTTALLQQLHSRRGQCLGQARAIGQESPLRKELDALRFRIRQLEDIYTAAGIALDTLEEARRNLQRRFSPGITRRAQEILSRLTEGRYNRLLLTEGLSLQAAAQNEDSLRNILCRSDGTTDQLYLALRLAVAEALTPNTPLILDDALVRFDDQRLAAAMDLLKELGAQRQILLFTCHSREEACL